MNYGIKFVSGIMIVVLALFLPTVLQAQDDLTLSSLAEQLESVKNDLKNSVSLLTIAGKDRAEAVTILSGKVIGLVERVVILEDLLSPQTFTDDRGYCRIALSKRLHATTLADYLDSFPDERLPETIWIESVWIGPDGDIAVIFETNPPGRYVTEYWTDCEFDGQSGWWDKDY